MAPVVTVVTGMLPGGAIYRATLNGPGGPQLPEHLRELAPKRGTLVAVPSGAWVPFDLDDPRSVFAWLRGSTSVLLVEGPDLTPPMESAPGVVY
jgi:hypothetical protein